METVHALPLAVVLVVVAVAAATDLWRFRLYNALTIPFFVSGVLYHSSIRGAEGLAGSVLGALVGAALLAPVYARGGMGAGDVKLIAGIGAWLGAWHVLHVMIVAGLATGVYATGLIIWNRMRGPNNQISGHRLEVEYRSFKRTESAMDLAAILRSAEVRRRVVPFGAMLALGVIGTFVWIGN